MKLTEEEREKRFKKLKDLEKIRFSLGYANRNIFFIQIIISLFSMAIIYFITFLHGYLIYSLLIIIIMALSSFSFYKLMKKNKDILDKFLIERSK